MLDAMGTSYSVRKEQLSWLSLYWTALKFPTIKYVTNIIYEQLYFPTITDMNKI